MSLGRLQGEVHSLSEMRPKSAFYQPSRSERRSRTGVILGSDLDSDRVKYDRLGSLSTATGFVYLASPQPSLPGHWAIPLCMLRKSSWQLGSWTTNHFRRYQVLCLHCTRQGSQSLLDEPVGVEIRKLGASRRDTALCRCSQYVPSAIMRHHQLCRHKACRSDPSAFVLACHPGLDDHTI